MFGVWYRDTGDMANTAALLKPAAEPTQSDGGSSLGTIYQGPFTIDAARGLVIFSEPVYRNTHASATGGSGYEVVIGPAQLVLRAACSVRDPETLALERYLRQRSTGAGNGAGTRFLKHDEIMLTHRPEYSESYALVAVRTNAADADRMSDTFLDVAEREYQIGVPQTAHYPGLLSIDLDGAIQQVGFQVGRSGATTTAARNNDLPRVALSHRDRRRLERQRETEAAAGELSPRGLARSLKTNPHTKPRPNA